MKKLSNLYTIFTLVILIPLDFECKDTTVPAHSNGFLPFIP